MLKCLYMAQFTRVIMAEELRYKFNLLINLAGVNEHFSRPIRDLIDFGNYFGEFPEKSSLHPLFVFKNCGDYKKAVRSLKKDISNSDFYLTVLGQGMNDFSYNLAMKGYDLALRDGLYIPMFVQVGSRRQNSLVDKFISSTLKGCVTYFNPKSLAGVFEETFIPIIKKAVLEDKRGAISSVRDLNKAWAAPVYIAGERRTSGPRF